MTSTRTESEIRDLALTLFSLQKNKYTPISGLALKIAGIGNLSEEEVGDPSKRKSKLISRNAKRLLERGLIVRYSKSYNPGVWGRLWSVKKTAVLEKYGQESIEEFRDKVEEALTTPASIETFKEVLETIVLPVQTSKVDFKVLAPGEIKITKSGERKSSRIVSFRGEYGKQWFKLCTFGSIDCLRAFIDSIADMPTPDLIPETVAFLNQTAPSSIHKFTFKLNIKFIWSKGQNRFTIKQSCRAYTPFCGFDKENERPEVLRQLGLDGDYDISSTVPRLEMLLNTGEWSTSPDLYKDLLDSTGIRREWTELERAHMKDTFMHLYYIKHRQRAWFSYFDRFHKGKNEDGYHLWNKSEFKELYQATRRLIGGSEASGIFWWESVVELRALEKLRKMGKKVVSVYDAFYFDTKETTATEIEQVIVQTAMEIYEEYRNGTRKAEVVEGEREASEKTCRQNGQGKLDRVSSRNGNVLRQTEELFGGAERFFRNVGTA